MSILLAGGAGYIGSHTAVELIKAGYDVVIVDNYDNSCPEVINRIERITGTTGDCEANYMMPISKRTWSAFTISLKPAVIPMTTEPRV